MTTALTVLSGPLPDVHPATWVATAHGAVVGLDATVTCVQAGSAEDFAAEAARVGAAGGTAVLVPGRELDGAAVRAAGAALGDAAVWCSPDATGEPGRTATGQLVVQGRGLGGLTGAVRRLVHHRLHAPEVVAYGDDAEQWADLRLPEARERPPVVVLVHGGFWRSPWQLDLMDALAVDLAARGIAAWNLEFRRPDRHGWDATTADVAAGIRALAGVADRVDLARVALLGHSAGAQLVLRAAADRVAPTSAALALVVSLAGVLDLTATARRNLGEGAVVEALGGPPERSGDVYRASCPLLRAPNRGTAAGRLATALWRR